jgi:hypothetical protein
VTAGSGCGCADPASAIGERIAVLMTGAIDDLALASFAQPLELPIRRS